MAPLTRLLHVAAASAAGLALSASALASGADPGPRVDPNYHRSVAAGPYCAVDTLQGGLTTTVPIVTLAAPGGLAWGVSLVHRSNHTVGTSYGMDGNGGVGAGWQTDLYQACVTAVDRNNYSTVQETRMNAPEQAWPYTTTINGTIQRWAFSRAESVNVNGTPMPMYMAKEDIARLSSSNGSTTTGFLVTSVDKRVTKFYTRKSVSNPNVFFL